MKGYIYVGMFLASQAAFSSPPLHEYIPAIHNELMKEQREENLHIIRDCIHPESNDFSIFETSNPLLGKLCDWSFVSSGGLDNQLVVTSTYRPHGRAESKHHKGLAVDAYRTFEGLVGHCAVLEDYREQVLSLDTWLIETGTEGRHGFGIYPYKLIVHVDVDDRRRRWAFDKDGKQISFAHCLKRST